MQNEILEALKNIELENECRILFAVESGSRAWGFASADSDYDVRAVYVKPEAWYWDIAEKKRDTIEAMLPHDIDVSAWELRKSLRLFDRCNPAFNEWLGSPVVYRADPEFLGRLRNLMPLFFNPVKAAHHYLAMASGAWKTMTPPSILTLKKLFYAFRALLCGSWCIEKQTMPPTEFIHVLDSGNVPETIRRELSALLHKKAETTEKCAVSVNEALRDFYASRREAVENAVKTMHFHPGPPDELNRLFYETATARHPGN